MGYLAFFTCPPPLHKHRPGTSSQPWVMFLCFSMVLTVQECVLKPKRLMLLETMGSQLASIKLRTMLIDELEGRPMKLQANVDNLYCWLGEKVGASKEGSSVCVAPFKQSSDSIMSIGTVSPFRVE